MVAPLLSKSMSPQACFPQISVNSTAMLTQLHSGQLLMVDPSCQGGLILCKCHYAEFAGPGAAVGGVFDLDCVRIIPVGDIALIYPYSSQERQTGYLKRQEWLASIALPSMNPVPLRRAQGILKLLEQYFDPNIVSRLPDNALAMLVGVLPQTIKMARHSSNQSASISAELASPTQVYHR